MDLVLCEPIELYNILNQVTKLSRLTEPNYLCLLGKYLKNIYFVSSVLQTLFLMNQQTFQDGGISDFRNLLNSLGIA